MKSAEAIESKLRDEILRMLYLNHCHPDDRNELDAYVSWDKIIAVLAGVDFTKALTEYASQGREWIEIKGGEELPDGVTSFKTMSDYVQVWIEGTHQDETGVGHGRYCHDRQQWFVTLCNFRTIENPIVTHWQKLPPPPKNS